MNLPDRRRLRLLLAGFFLALAIPSLILVTHAYGQLKWEALHQQQLLAEEIAGRIENRLRGWLQIEERRSVTDYDFLVVEGGAEANFLQRSPLSELPIQSELPGLIGYFQVDPDGRFSTPLLPAQEQVGQKYGLSSADQDSRAALARRLYDILSRNELVDRPALREDAAAKEEKPAGSDMPLADRERASPEPARKDADLDTQQKAAAFDALQKAPSEGQVRQQLPESLGRVSDLKLDRVEAGARESERPPASAPERRKRREESVVAAQAEPEFELDEASESFADFRISTFESEIDPLDFALLDSGHFVLFRNVWRDTGRMIQGMLIDPAAFIEGLAASEFQGAALARNSELLVAFRDEIFRVFGGSERAAYLTSADEMAGTLLHRARMPSPLEELQLVFTVNRLPAGPGAGVILWMTAIIALVLCAGTWLLYRAGSRQLQLAEQQRDFVAAVSHELKTPLTSIRMYAEMLRAGWTDPDKVRGYYDYIYNESERLSRLIANVLRLSRITHQESGLDIQRHTLGELFDTLHPKVAAQVQAADFELVMEPPNATHAEVEVDADAFAQIVINLVDNALKFSRRADKRRVKVVFRVAEGQLICTVRDFGPGIPRNQMKKIFRLFYRSESELTRETVGTGIGLALVNELTTAMGGKVDVRNRDPGAEFVVKIRTVS